MTPTPVSICPDTLQTQAGVRFLSVCSGIEAASVAWGPLGWRALAFSEIEPFPSAVLAHHYPSVPNLGDMTALPEKIRDGVIDAPEILCGGTPCQAFSVAGLRRSLEDDRGNLSLTFCEIANAIDAVRAIRGAPPSVVFWENVPGVLSTKDNAFGCFLAGLAGEDLPLEPPGGKWTDAGCVHGPARTVAWRIFDAQYFGLAQRRKRVFVVASARDGFDPAAVLFEWEGVRRDSAPSREAGQRIAASVADSAGIGQPYSVANCLTQRMYKGINTTLDEGQTPVLAHAFDARQSDVVQYGDKTGPLDTDGHSIAVGVTLHGTDGTQSVASFTDLSSSLRARIPSGVENSTTTAVMQPVAHVDTMPTMLNGANTPAGHNARSGHTKDQYIEQAGTLLRGGQGGRHDGVLAFHPTQDPINSTEVCHSIGTGNGQGCATAAVAFPIQECNVSRANLNGTGTGIGQEGDPMFTLQAAQPHGVATPAVAFDTYNQSIDGDVTHTLRVSTDNGLQSTPHVFGPAMRVRRLTPRECERLQGFPDGYTAIPWRGKPADQCPDGPRYKALGNSWAVPCITWIGARIDRELRGELRPET